MKKGDYVLVTESRGCWTGTVQKVTKLRVYIECKCCFAWRIVAPEKVEVQE